MMLDRSMRMCSDEATDAILAELVERFIDRLQEGDAVDPGEFAAEHPDYQKALLDLLPAAATMARLRLSSRKTGPPSLPLRLRSITMGGYRIVREIGRGGMGVVYEAFHDESGRKVALKVLPISSTTDPRQVERFRIEGQAAAALDHPHIVPVFEIGREQGVHFFAMQFIEGCSLAGLIDEATPGEKSALLSPRGAARLALEAAEALAHAHDLGIVHRDVKPANLLVDAEGHLWVADFGLARFLDGGNLTRTGDVIGTLRYLSPEQAGGRRKPDARSDVYSLGATLYEMLTLRPAFDGQDRQELLRKITRDEPTPVRKIDPAIPRDLETILASAMAKEVNDRYGSAADLAEDLRRFLAARPILARRPDLLTRAARCARRNRAAMVIGSAVLALFLLGAGIGVAMLYREQVRTRENLRVALIALDAFCLSTNGPDLTRDPERTQEVQNLQLKALDIYERMLRQNPSDAETRWAAALAEHRVGDILARSPRFAEAEPAYEAAHRNLTLLREADPRSVPYRREMADVLAAWGAAKPVGGNQVKTLRRQALADHERLAAEFPQERAYARAVSRDCIEVARTIGITNPAEAVEKEALFRRAVAIRQASDDRSFEGRAEEAEALAFLGHLLNATKRGEEGRKVMNRGQTLLALLVIDSPGDPYRRRRVVLLQDLFSLPRYCEPAPNPEDSLAMHRASLAGRALLVAEFPYLPEFRASLAWSHHGLAATLRGFGRSEEAEAEERRSVALFDELLRDHPSVTHYHRWGALANESLGDILQGSSRLDEARTVFRRALAILPDAPRMRDRLAHKLQASVAAAPGSTSQPVPSLKGNPGE